MLESERGVGGLRRRGRVGEKREGGSERKGEEMSVRFFPPGFLPRSGGRLLLPPSLAVLCLFLSFPRRPGL